VSSGDLIGLAGILLAVGLVIFLAFRGFSLLLAAPAVSLVAALFAGEPLLATWTIPFMGGVGRFIVNFFPIFMLGAVFGKLMDDSGSALAIARAITEKLGAGHALAAVVLACALLTYGGVSLFVVSFAVYPVADALFRQANIPHRLIPAAIALGAFTFTMTALPGTPAIQNAIPTALFGTTLFAAPGLGVVAAAVMLGFGLWWLSRATTLAGHVGEGYGPDEHETADPQLVRDRAVAADAFDPAELPHGRHSDSVPSLPLALTPIAVVLVVNLLMTWVVLPRMDTSFLAEPRWGGTQLASVSGIWSVLTALIVASVVLVLVNLKRLADLRSTLDAGAAASVLPVFNTASLAGFGAVVAALPAFAVVSEALLTLPGGPLVSLAVAASVMAAITGSASAALIITLDTFGQTLADMGQQAGIDASAMHRIASLACGPLAMLPHNGATVTLLGICGATMRGSYRDIAMVTLVGPLMALVVAVVLVKTVGSF
jgi:H+/gluconate symporter-like permease